MRNCVQLCRIARICSHIVQNSAELHARKLQGLQGKSTCLGNPRFHWNTNFVQNCLRLAKTCTILVTGPTHVDMVQTLILSNWTNNKRGGLATCLAVQLHVLRFNYMSCGLATYATSLNLVLGKKKARKYWGFSMWSRGAELLSILYIGKSDVYWLGFCTKSSSDRVHILRGTLWSIQSSSWNVCSTDGSTQMGRFMKN